MGSSSTRQATSHDKKKILTFETLQEKLHGGRSEDVLRLFRSSSPEELKRSLCEITPSIMQRLSGKEGFQAKRYLVMREDVLPEAWLSFFEDHAQSLFKDELDRDCVLQRVLADRFKWCVQSKRMQHSRIINGD
jgi:hypothetical protein